MKEYSVPIKNVTPPVPPMKWTSQPPTNTRVPKPHQVLKGSPTCQPKNGAENVTTPLEGE